MNKISNQIANCTANFSLLVVNTEEISNSSHVLLLIYSERESLRIHAHIYFYIYKLASYIRGYCKAYTMSLPPIYWSPLANFANLLIYSAGGGS
jgi:hypothetical protein